MSVVFPKEDDFEVLDLGPSLSKKGGLKPSCLMGKVCAQKVPNVFAVMEVMKKAFRPKRKLTVRDWGSGMVIFTFESGEDREWVVRNQPWHFDGSLFAIRPLEGSEQPSSISISKASFWTRAYDLPVDAHNEGTLRCIAKRVGGLECYEKPEELEPNPFLQFKVEVD